MSKLLAFLNDRPGASAADAVDMNAPRATPRGGFLRSRVSLQLQFPKALTPGFIVVGLSDLQQRAVEVVESKQGKAPATSCAPSATGDEVACAVEPSQQKCYDLIMRDLVRRGDQAVIAQFSSLEDAKEALAALQAAASRRVKKRWLLASAFALVFVVFLMPIPSGSAGKQDQQRASLRSDYGSTPTQMLAMPPRTGGLASAGLQPAVQPPASMLPQVGAMSQGAFPAPMAPSNVGVATNGVDTSTLPSPNQGLIPSHGVQMAQPQAAHTPGQPAAQQRAQGSADDDPFGLKIVPGANPANR